MCDLAVSLKAESQGSIAGGSAPDESEATTKFFRFEQFQGEGSSG